MVRIDAVMMTFVVVVAVVDIGDVVCLFVFESFQNFPPWPDGMTTRTWGLSFYSLSLSWFVFFFVFPLLFVLLFFYFNWVDSFIYINKEERSQVSLYFGIFSAIFLSISIFLSLCLCLQVCVCVYLFSVGFIRFFFHTLNVLNDKEKIQIYE